MVLSPKVWWQQRQRQKGSNLGPLRRWEWHPHPLCLRKRPLAPSVAVAGFGPPHLRVEVAVVTVKVVVDVEAVQVEAEVVAAEVEVVAAEVKVVAKPLEAKPLEAKVEVAEDEEVPEEVTEDAELSEEAEVGNGEGAPPSQFGVSATLTFFKLIFGEENHLFMYL